MTKFYTGIGSRETPVPILSQMSTLADHLAGAGWTLRSGGAPGADTAFADGAASHPLGKVVIYLPWSGFNGVCGVVPPFTDEVMTLAARYHLAWGACSAGARKMHARNVYQVLGDDLRTPSKFVVCWTKDGKGGGGSGQAIRIARAHGVPVFDLGLKGVQAADVVRFVVVR